MNKYRKKNINHTERLLRTPLITQNVKDLIVSGLPVDDSIFDALLPQLYQSVSIVHWTPIKAIRQIAEFISTCDSNSKFLDIGSGCGKLCILLSLLTKMNIYGVEQRIELHKVAERIKKANAIKNVHFICGNMLELDWSKFDIYYLYNPFQEHVIDFENMRIDDRIAFDKKNYMYYTSEVYRQLCWARPGKKLITFHGYGGPIPSTWRLTQSRTIGYGHLSMWENKP